MFYRTIRMLDSGLKPVFVFDGKPPELKGGEVRRAVGSWGAHRMKETERVKGRRGGERSAAAWGSHAASLV